MTSFYDIVNAPIKPSANLFTNNITSNNIDTITLVTDTITTDNIITDNITTDNINTETINVSVGITGPGAPVRTIVVNFPVNTATITVAIPSGGNRMSLSGVLQVNSASSDYDYIFFQCNGDTGPNYGYVNGETPSVPSNEILLCGTTSSENAEPFGYFNGIIPCYSNPNVPKNYTFTSGGLTTVLSSYYVFSGSGVWLSNAPITSITFFTNNPTTIAAKSQIIIQIT